MNFMRINNSIPHFPSLAFFHVPLQTVYRTLGRWRNDARYVAADDKFFGSGGERAKGTRACSFGSYNLCNFYHSKRLLLGSADVSKHKTQKKRMRNKRGGIESIPRLRRETRTFAKSFGSLYRIVNVHTTKHNAELKINRRILFSKNTKRVLFSRRQ